MPIRTIDGGVVTCNSMSEGTRGACVLCTTGKSGFGAGVCALRRALRRARFLYSYYGGNTAG